MKKYLFGLGAIVMAISFTAFNSATWTPTWKLSNQADETSVSNRTNPAKYITAGAVTCTSDETHICRIFAEDVSPADGKPDIGTSGPLYDALFGDGTSAVPPPVVGYLEDKN